MAQSVTTMMPVRSMKSVGVFQSFSAFRIPAFAFGSGAASLNRGRVEAQRRRAYSAFRNRIVSAFAPRMAAANPIYRQPAAGDGAVRVERFHRVFGAGGCETAAAARAKKKNLCRRNCELVPTNGQRQNSND